MKDKNEFRTKMAMMKKMGAGNKTITGMNKQEDKKMIVMMMRGKKGAK